MKNRNIFAVLLLTIITFGIYAIYWEVSTKIEMNKLGAKIPTAWLLIIPIVNIWWLWKYSEGVELVTGKKMSGILAFVLLWLLGVIGAMIIQSEFNKVGDQPMAAAPEAVTAPAPGFGAPAVTQDSTVAPTVPTTSTESTEQLIAPSAPAIEQPQSAPEVAAAAPEAAPQATPEAVTTAPVEAPADPEQTPTDPMTPTQS